MKFRPAFLLLLGFNLPATAGELAKETVYPAASLVSLVKPDAARLPSRLLHARERFFEIREREELIARQEDLVQTQFRRIPGRSGHLNAALTGMNGQSRTAACMMANNTGWVLFPRNSTDEKEELFNVELENGEVYRLPWRVFPGADHLSIIRLPDPVGNVICFPEIHSGFPADSNPLTPGKFVGAMLPCGEWITGSITGLSHKGEEHLDLPVRESLSEHWSRVKTPVSSRRDGFFKDAVTADLPLSAEQCGIPVFSIHGDCIGLALARTDVQETVILPRGRLLLILQELAMADPAADTHPSN